MKNYMGSAAKSVMPVRTLVLTDFRSAPRILHCKNTNSVAFGLKLRDTDASVVLRITTAPPRPPCPARPPAASPGFILLPPALLGSSPLLPPSYYWFLASPRAVAHLELVDKCKLVK